MVAPAVGEVMLVRFPFSDLSQSKVRPAVCLASTGRDDWILCQITSKQYGDSRAVPLNDPDFTTGGLKLASYARPGKLFTANRSLMATSIGKLNDAALQRVIGEVIRLLTASVP